MSPPPWLPHPERRETGPTHCERLTAELPPQLSSGAVQIAHDVRVTLPHLRGPPHEEVLPLHVPGHAEQDVKK